MRCSRTVDAVLLRAWCAKHVAKREVAECHPAELASAKLPAEYSQCTGAALARRWQGSGKVKGK
eukprot:123443-Alexandrium_andersonii.AAC.1